MDRADKSTSAAVERERAFFDARADRYRVVRQRIARAIGPFNRSDDVHSLYDPAGKRVLDYGCGEGRFSIELLERGAAHVTGIDISEVRVAAARDTARRMGVEDRTTFLVADAHDTGLPAKSFELVIGSDILHHLDIAAAAREIRRVLEPGGAGIFVEPLAHNPLLRLGRALTPSARTVDEHPLTVDDWRLLGELFPGFRHEERELVSVPLMPLNLLLPASLQRGLARRVAPLDERLIRRIPALRRYSRRTLLYLGT